MSIIPVIRSKIRAKIYKFLFDKGWKRERLCLQMVPDSAAFTTYTKEGLADYLRVIKEDAISKFIRKLTAKNCIHPIFSTMQYFPYLENHDAAGIRIIIQAYTRYGWRKHLPLSATIREEQFWELHKFIPKLRKLLEFKEV